MIAVSLLWRFFVPLLSSRYVVILLPLFTVFSCGLMNHLLAKSRSRMNHLIGVFLVIVFIICIPSFVIKMFRPKTIPSILSYQKTGELFYRELKDAVRPIILTDSKRMNQYLFYGWPQKVELPEFQVAHSEKSLRGIYEKACHNNDLILFFSEKNRLSKDFLAYAKQVHPISKEQGSLFLYLDDNRDSKAFGEEIRNQSKRLDDYEVVWKEDFENPQLRSSPPSDYARKFHNTSLAQAESGYYLQKDRWEWPLIHNLQSGSFKITDSANDILAGKHSLRVDVDGFLTLRYLGEQLPAEEYFIYCLFRGTPRGWMAIQLLEFDEKHLAISSRSVLTFSAIFGNTRFGIGQITGLKPKTRYISLQIMCGGNVIIDDLLVMKPKMQKDNHATSQVL